MPRPREFSEFERRWIKDQNGSASRVCERFEEKFRRRIAPVTVNRIRKPDGKKRPVGVSLGAVIGDPTPKNQDPDASTTLIRPEIHPLAGLDPFGTSWLNDDFLHAFLQAISSQDVCIWRSDVFDESSPNQPELPDSCRLILTPLIHSSQCVLTGIERVKEGPAKFRVYSSKKIERGSWILQKMENLRSRLITIDLDVLHEQVRPA